MVSDDDVAICMLYVSLFMEIDSNTKSEVVINPLLKLTELFAILGETSTIMHCGDGNKHQKRPSINYTL